jgi:hypothetical protein
MNFVFMSPHFPPNYYRFCVNLRKMGANVLGLADEPYDKLHPDLRWALNEYYRVNDMNNYSELLRALGYFTFRYGKLDRIDSLNEYWLETEARLRSDFNIPGLNTADIYKVKRKSEMKKVFKKVGVAVAAGQLIHTASQTHRFVDEVGYPVVIKPDIGVGASNTHKIHNNQELDRFLANRPAEDYIIEQFIQGNVESFDGLTDKQGKVVFCTSHVFSQGIMETVNDELDIFYYSVRDIPKDLEDFGRKLISAFEVRERFFHFEFFRTPDKRLVALEVNMRPPGGMTTDMFNYANDIDIYYEYANVILNNRFDAVYCRPYYCCYIGRKEGKRYIYSHEDIVEIYGSKIVCNEPLSGVFSSALGNYGYLARSEDLEEILEIAQFVLETESPIL